MFRSRAATRSAARCVPAAIRPFWSICSWALRTMTAGSTTFLTCRTASAATIPSPRRSRILPPCAQVARIRAAVCSAPACLMSAPGQTLYSLPCTAPAARMAACRRPLTCSASPTPARAIFRAPSRWTRTSPSVWCRNMSSPRSGARCAIRPMRSASSFPKRSSPASSSLLPTARPSAFPSRTRAQS